MSDHQKDAFAERLRRIEQNPGNGRLVEPGAADIFEDDKKKKKKPGKGQVIAKKKRDLRPRVKLGWLYGFVTGFIMFLAWINIYPDMSTPRSWSLSALPVPPRDAAIWVGGIVFFGLAVVRQFNLRVVFVMLIGMLMGGAVLAAIAAFVPGIGATLTNETFVGQMQSFVASIELE